MYRYNRKRYAIAGFEILTAVTAKSTIFWDVTPCTLVEINRLSDEYTAFVLRIEK
jgi:hypothetical protein